MGLLDALFGNGSGGGLLGGLPAAWQYQNPGTPDPAFEKRRRDADFMAAINQNADNGYSPDMATPFVGGAAPAGVTTASVGGSTPFGLGGITLPQAPLPQGTPASGPFPAVPPAMFAQPQSAPAPASPQAIAAPPPPVPQPAPAHSPQIAQPAGPVNIMDIGGYKMPQFGTAADYTPPAGADEEDTPTGASAQSRTSSPAPASAPMIPPAFMRPASAGGFGGAARGAMANMQGGPLGMIAGAVAGAMGMGQGNPQDIQRQNLKAQYDALIANGMTQQQAMLTILNPEAGKTLIAQQLGPDHFQHVTRKDQFGGEEVGAFNPTTGKTTFGAADGAPSASGGVQGMVNGITQARNSGASRADLIRQIPPQYQGYISALLDGKATPANIGRGQARGALMTLAHAVDPTFDETMIPARIATATDFTPKGKSGASIVAFNTVQHHIGKLSDDFENLGNAGQGGFAAVNAIRNGLAAGTPIDPVRQKAVQAVNDDLKAVSDEMSAAYKAGHVSDTEIKSWNSLVNSNMPLNQARQAISDFVDLLNGKRDALNKVHQQIMGSDASIIDKDENAMITQKVHARNGSAAPALARVASPADAAKLPRGTHFIDPNGIERIVP